MKLREQKIERAMKIVWESLSSHLPYTYKKHPDGSQFHKKAIKDYSELIKILSELQ